MGQKAIVAYISEDPIGFKGGSANLFEYAKNSPIMFNDPSGESVYRCTRKLDRIPLSSIALNYLGLGHRYLWVDSLGAGYGLAPKNGYWVFVNAATLLDVPGIIKEEDAQIGCELITDCPSIEEKFKQVIYTELSKTHAYNLVYPNCYDWAKMVEKAAMGE